MRRWLSWAVVLAGVLILVGVSDVREAEACSVGPSLPYPQAGECVEAFVFPESDIIPANLGAFEVRFVRGATPHEEAITFALVQGEEVTELAAEEVSGLRVRGGEVLMEVDVAGLLEPGPVTLQVTMPCRPAQGEQSAPLRTEVQEFVMEVGEPVEIGGELVGLRVNEQGKRKERLPEGASCSRRQRAQFATISARVPAELEPWREVLHWRTEVRFDSEGQFRTWVDNNSMGYPVEYGRSRSGAGRDRLWARCNTGGSGDFSRISEVRMVATLPGTDQELRTETRRVNLECTGLFGCAAAPAPTPARLPAVVGLLMLAGVVVWRRRWRGAAGGEGEVG